MFYLRFIFLFCIVCSSICHANEDLQSDAEIKSILVLGDSLSAAYGFKPELGWVHLLQQRLFKEYNNNPKWNIINASVSGETTAGGLARLPKLIELHQPVLCIIELGGNDGLRGHSISLIRKQLDKIISTCNQSASSMLLGIKLPPNYGERYSLAFEQIYSDLSRLHNIPLVPFLLEGVALQKNFMQQDGIHPTESAQPTILENVWPQLNDQLITLK